MVKHMRGLLEDVYEFFRKDFHLTAYSYTFAVAAASIILVYGTGFGDAISNNLIPTSSAVINNMIMFAFLYFAVAVPATALRGEFGTLPKAPFFAKGLLLMCLIGFADVFSWTEVLSMDGFTAAEQSYIAKALWRMRNMLFVLPVLVLLRLTADRDVDGLYGVRRGKQRIRAYLSLYVFILPVLFATSFTPDFLSYYPMYKPWLFEGVFDRPTWLNTVIFETVYISDFFMVEMIFRGVLVIGMASILGRTAVLPMIVVYVALHFGKPVLETVSALFGGYFLGALAFQTRHIWGGIIIHMGIALIIELTRFFQYYALGM